MFSKYNRQTGKPAKKAVPAPVKALFGAGFCRKTNRHFFRQTGTYTFTPRFDSLKCVPPTKVVSRDHDDHGSFVSTTFLVYTTPAGNTGLLWLFGTRFVSKGTDSNATLPKASE